MYSGASRHTCSNLMDFISIRPYTEFSSHLPKRTNIEVKSDGNVKINDNLLRDVLPVSKFKFNLFYVGSFIAQMAISFLHDCFTIQDLNLKKAIDKGRKVNNLYVLKAALPFEYAANTISVQVWHNRLGHPSKNILDCLQD